MLHAGRSAAPKGSPESPSAQPACEHAVPLRPGGAVRADNGTTRSDAHAAAVQAANEEVDHVTSSMGSVSISPPPSYSDVVVWAPSVRSHHSMPWRYDATCLGNAGEEHRNYHCVRLHSVKALPVLQCCLALEIGKAVSLWLA